MCSFASKRHIHGSIVQHCSRVTECHNTDCGFPSFLGGVGAGVMEEQIKSTSYSPACLGLLISSIFQVHTPLVEWLADLYNIAVYKYAKCNKNIFILACYLHIGWYCYRIHLDNVFSACQTLHLWGKLLENKNAWWFIFLLMSEKKCILGYYLQRYHGVQ